MIEQGKNLVGRRQEQRDDEQRPVLFGVSIKKVHGLRVAPIIPSNLDGRKRLAIQESGAANHALRKKMVGPNGLEPSTSAVSILRSNTLKPFPDLAFPHFLTFKMLRNSLVLMAS